MNYYRSRLFLVLVSLACLIGLSGCGKDPEVKVARAEFGPVEATVTSVNSGTVKAEKIAELAFGAVGRVRKLNVELGTRVKQGQILAEIENDDLSSALKTATAEMKRQESLTRSRAASEYDVDRARTAFELAQANFEKGLIRAPYDGIIVELNLEVGQLAQITAINPRAMVRIVDVAPRYIRAEIDEVDLPKVRVGMSATVKILAVRHEPFKAVVRKIVPFVSSAREQDRTTEIELNVENEGQLLPAGASADVEVLTERREHTLSIPARALFGRLGQRYVYKITSGELEQVPVKQGIFNYDRAEILDGIQAGDTLALPADQVELKSGLKIRPVIAK